MDMTTSFQSINLLAVLVAAIFSFVLGAIWYNPKVFGTAWMEENGFVEDDLKGGNMGMIFGTSFVLYLISSIVLAMFLGPEADMTFGIIAGIFTAIPFIGTSIGINYLFERRSLKLWFINVGYATVCYAVMGAIIGAWH